MNTTTTQEGDGASALIRSFFFQFVIHCALAAVALTVGIFVLSMTVQFSKPRVEILVSALLAGISFPVWLLLGHTIRSCRRFRVQPDRIASNEDIAYLSSAHLLRLARFSLCYVSMVAIVVSACLWSEPPSTGMPLLLVFYGYMMGHSAIHQKFWDRRLRLHGEESKTKKFEMLRATAGREHVITLIRLNQTLFLVLGFGVLVGCPIADLLPIAAGTSATILAWFQERVYGRMIELFQEGS